MELNEFRNRKVFVTGHTGFKGSWLCKILSLAGADVTGFALCPPTDPSLFSLLRLDREIRSVEGDVRDFEALEKAYLDCDPDYVIHLAAQPIVRESYRDPVGTYETNVMGTVHLLECVRKHPGVRSVLNVTTDKVYHNNEWAWGYREDEPLDGYDPYSNSKSCSELVTHSYVNSFFGGKDSPAVSTARAGNVIGGGDFARDRIIPDCIRAAIANQTVTVRNPYSTRPYQHVLEPLFAYLMILSEQEKDPSLAGSYNVGPDDGNCVCTGELVDCFCEKWGEGAKWESRYDGGPHEANFLKLDCSKLKSTFGWKPVWTVERAMEQIVEWTRCWQAGGDLHACMEGQIEQYLQLWKMKKGENDRGKLEK